MTVTKNLSTMVVQLRNVRVQKKDLLMMKKNLSPQFGSIHLKPRFRMRTKKILMRKAKNSLGRARKLSSIRISIEAKLNADTVTAWTPLPEAYGGE